MVDVFEEVEEQIRAERYKALGLKLLPWVIGLVVVGVLAAGGIWGWDYWTRTQGEKAASTYVEALKAGQEGDQTRAFTLLDDVAKAPVKGYPSLALMTQAGMRLEAGKTEEAIKLLDQAAKKASDPAIADLAAYKAALLLVDTAPYKDLEARLTPLMAEKRPYAMEAREALAFAKIMAGKPNDAKADFIVLSQALTASDGMRERAQAALRLIDSGSAAVMPAAAKLSATLPPPPPQMPQGMMPQGPEGPAQ